MGASSNLAEQLITFKSIGLADVKAGIDALKAGLETLDVSCKGMADQMDKSFGNVAAGVEKAKSALSGLASGVSTALASISNKAASLGTGAAVLVSEISTALSNLGSKAGAVFQAIGGTLAAFISGLQAAIGIVTTTLQGAIGAALTLAGMVGGNLQKALEKFNEEGRKPPPMLKFAADMQKALQSMAAGFQFVAGVVNGLTSRIQGLTGSIQGWVRSGLQGTVQNGAMALSMQMLSREIAGVFLPTVEKVTEMVRGLTGWFRNLSGEQQDSIRRWVESGAAMAFVSAGIAKLASMAIGVAVPAITALVTAATTGALTVASAVNLATAGIAAVLGAIATAITGIMVGTQAGRHALSGLMDTLKPLLDGLGRMYDQVSSRLGPILEQFADSFGRGLQDAVPTLLEIGDAIVEVVAGVARLVDYFAKLAGFSDAGDFLAKTINSSLENMNRFLQMAAGLVRAVEAGFLSMARTLETVVNKSIDGIVSAIRRTATILNQTAVGAPVASELLDLARGLQGMRVNLNLDGAKQDKKKPGGRERSAVTLQGGGRERGENMWFRAIDVQMKAADAMNQARRDQVQRDLLEEMRRLRHLQEKQVNKNELRR